MFPWEVCLIRGDYVVAQFRTEGKARDYARALNTDGQCRRWKARETVASASAPKELI